MKRIKSCGILLMTRSEPRSFLLMRHADRWDLPKGHVDPGESDLECALREFEEETGIDRARLELDERFQYEDVYVPRSEKSGAAALKTLVIFLATVPERLEVTTTEHLGAEWFPWNPPHRIQAQAIDPLLAAVERHLARYGT